MKKYKIVHYINQFFAGIGGEEKADYKPELREGYVGITTLEKISKLPQIQFLKW